MSDCAHGGRYPRKWTDQEWHAPKASPRREVAGVPAIGVTYHFRHGLRPLPHTVPGQGEGGAARELDYIEADGERFVRAPSRDWDDCEVD